MHDHPSFALLSDDQLTTMLSRLALKERAATVELLGCLAEFDHRRLYCGLGYTSIFAYAKDALHLADGAAYKRITVARASRRYPVVLDMIGGGRLSLSTACLVAVKLTLDTADALLSEATGKTKREVESILARRHPQPPVESILRKLPQVPAPAAALPEANAPSSITASALRVETRASAPPSISQPASRRPVLAPLSEAHYKLQVTISTAAHDRLRHIQDLMRHTVPNGDPAVIVERALELLHIDLLKKKAALVAKPRSVKERDGAAQQGRAVPASVRREVWLRDEGRCAFVSEQGRRCGERGALEYHHVHPHAQGGEMSVQNIELRCRAHNSFEWELFSLGLTK